MSASVGRNPEDRTEPRDPREPADHPTVPRTSSGPGRALVAVGPEGGWTDREVEMATVTATLGPRNLRAETAALVGLAIALSDRGG